MFDNTKSIKLYVSDFHMGEGVLSPHEDFKYHPPGIPMEDTTQDFVLDKYFDDFVNWILNNLAHCPDVQLYLNGDIFDFSSIALSGQSIAFPYEAEATAKFKIIMSAHPLFFEALNKFCLAKNTTLKFFKGNHDWELNWPAVQNIIVQRISPEQPEKVSFLYEEFDKGTYCRHGENEPSIKSNYEKPIITCLDLAKLPVALKKAGLNFAIRDVLDVPLSYYLIGDLMYHIKPYNYLIGRMHTHGFVWLDSLKHIGRQSWYRSRLFPFIAAYYFFRTLFGNLLFVRFWHIKMKATLKKILQLLWWTATGVLTGTTPRDSAMKVLYSKENVDCTVYSHEHECTFEVIQVNNNIKTYINTGTWMPQFRDKALAKLVPWKRLGGLQKLFKLIRDIFVKRELEVVWKCPVGLETINDCGNTSRQLVEWDKDEKTLKQMS